MKQNSKANEYANPLAGKCLDEKLRKINFEKINVDLIWHMRMYNSTNHLD